MIQTNSKLISRFLSFMKSLTSLGFPCSSVSKESACNARGIGDMGSVPGSGRSPGGGNGNPLQYSCLENPVDRGAWWATVHRVTKSQTRLSEHAHSTKDYRIIKLSELE